jgi:hypothetical protein
MSKELKFVFRPIRHFEDTLDKCEVTVKGIIITIDGEPAKDKYNVWKCIPGVGLKREHPSALHNYTKVEAVAKAKELIATIQNS